MQPDLEWEAISLPQYFLSISSQNNCTDSVVFFPCGPFPSLFLFLRQNPEIHVLETEHLIYPVWVVCAPSIWGVGGRHPPWKKTDEKFPRSTQCVYRKNAEWSWGNSERSKCSPACGITRVPSFGCFCLWTHSMRGALISILYTHWSEDDVSLFFFFFQPALGLNISRQILGRNSDLIQTALNFIEHLQNPFLPMLYHLFTTEF